MSSENARRFYFTTERDSYAAKLGQAANLGVISAVFFRERGQPTTVPNQPRPRQAVLTRPEKKVRRPSHRLTTNRPPRASVVQYVTMCSGSTWIWIQRPLVKSRFVTNFARPW